MSLQYASIIFDLWIRDDVTAIDDFFTVAFIINDFCNRSIITKAIEDEQFFIEEESPLKYSYKTLDFLHCIINNIWIVNWHVLNRVTKRTYNRWSCKYSVFLLVAANTLYFFLEPQILCIFFLEPQILCVSLRSCKYYDHTHQIYLDEQKKIEK